MDETRISGCWSSLNFFLSARQNFLILEQPAGIKVNSRTVLNLVREDLWFEKKFPGNCLQNWMPSDFKIFFFFAKKLYEKHLLRGHSEDQRGVHCLFKFPSIALKSLHYLQNRGELGPRRRRGLEIFFKLSWYIYIFLGEKSKLWTHRVDTRSS